MISKQIRIEEQHGQRLLTAWGFYEGKVRVRLLSEDVLVKLSDDNFKRYKKRAKRIIRVSHAIPNLTDPSVIKALDYFKAVLARETTRRGL